MWERRRKEAGGGVRTLQTGDEAARGIRERTRARTEMRPRSAMVLQLLFAACVVLSAAAEPSSSHAAPWSRGTYGKLTFAPDVQSYTFAYGSADELTRQRDRHNRHNRHQRQPC